MAAIPEGFHSVTPHIAASDASAAIDHYVDALGAELLMKMTTPDGAKIMHSCLQIGSSKIFLCDEFEKIKAPKDGNGGAHFYVYVEDVDGAHKQALDAGMTETMARDDMFWGDRMSGLRDKFGHYWDLATHMRHMTEDDLARAMENMPG